MPHEIASLFKTLFNLICARHQGPVNLEFGHQMHWDGIVAGKCASYVQFIQTDELYAILDTRINKVVFSTGTVDTLQRLLDRQMEKTVKDMALTSIKMSKTPPMALKEAS